MTNIYIVSLSLNSAVVYTGNRHYMSIKAACRRFADDAIAFETDNTHYEARDVLKLRSAGTAHMSVTERELIAAASVAPCAAITHAVVQIGYCVFGVGSSRDEAVADAAQWMSGENEQPGISVDEVEAVLVPRHGAAHGQIIVMESGHPDFDSYMKIQGGFKKIRDGWFPDQGL